MEGRSDGEVMGEEMMKRKSEHRTQRTTLPWCILAPGRSLGFSLDPSPLKRTLRRNLAWFVWNRHTETPLSGVGDTGKSWRGDLGRDDGSFRGAQARVGCGW